MPDDLGCDEAEQPPAESLEHRGRRYIRHTAGLETIVDRRLKPDDADELL